MKDLKSFHLFSFSCFGKSPEQSLAEVGLFCFSVSFHQRFRLEHSSAEHDSYLKKKIKNAKVVQCQDFQHDLVSELPGLTRRT